MKTILYLYREIMPYNINVLNELVSLGYRLIVFQDYRNKLSTYTTDSSDGIVYYKQEDFTYNELRCFAESLAPEVIFIADRTISKYNKLAVHMRKKYDTPILVGCDSQWKGGKQWLNVLTSPFRHKRYFSNILVAGMRQYEYARKLGFRPNTIAWPLYSADNELFYGVRPLSGDLSQRKKILFVGRFEKVKGINYLLDAWNNIIDKKGWKLVLVGDGSLKMKLAYPKGVELRDFMLQSELKKLAEECACFVLPSVFEPWALVIHEFAAAGLPLVVTNACGAADHFVINNYNGFKVEPRDVASLHDALNKIISADNEMLISFGNRSREIAKGITPAKVAGAILSVIKK